MATGQLISVHTNRIEGTWKHAKTHFQKMTGTKATQWEGHMAEVMWRSVVKGDVYNGFCRMVKEVYTPNYTYTTRLFDSWYGVDADNEVVPQMTDQVCIIQLII